MREDGIDRLITIPPGNYSADVFASTLIELLNTGAPAGWTYNITLPNSFTSPDTAKFTYTVTGNATQPSIVCTDQVEEQLGFAINSVNTFIDNSLTSSTVVNFGCESTMFLHSDIASNGDNDILQEIYSNNTIPFSYITYQCTAPELYSKELNTNQANVFHFSLTNEKNQLMNLHGVDMQITLALYKKDDTNELIRQYIKYKVHSEPKN
jgi:hypothetical protein